MSEIIFAGSGHTAAAALKSLQASFAHVYVLSSCGANVLSLCREGDAVIDGFDSSDCKYVFLSAYAPPITKEQLDCKTYIAIHGALLPKYRGCQPTFWAMMNGEPKMGVTFHLVGEYMDAGDTLAQFEYDYTGQTVGEVNHIIDGIIFENSGNVARGYINGTIIPRPQEHEKATYCAKSTLEDCRLNLEWDNATIRNFFRALSEPYPLPRVRLRGVDYEITEYQLRESKYFGPLGRVINADRDGLWIRTREGFLIISGLRSAETQEDVNPRYLVPIGYRILSIAGGERDCQIFDEYDDEVYAFLKDNVNIMPMRFVKLIANFYTDARVRKIYWQKLGVQMGEGTFANLGMQVTLGEIGKLIIGANVSIAPNVTFVIRSEPNNGIDIKRVPYVSGSLVKDADIVVEDDVWIGAGVTILPGCRIGKCSVIGAGAVVIGNVKPHSVYAGVPAKRIRDLSHEQ